MSNGIENQYIKISSILLQGGRILDPGKKIDKISDLLIKNRKIIKIGNINVNDFNGKIIDCKNKIIVPGFIDMHAHLREPGREDEETIETGCRAAMAGGFTSICCMPNTNPPIDNSGIVEFIKERSEGCLVDVHPIAAITKGQKGEELTEMGDLVEAGAVGFSDDGHPVEKASILRRALEYAKIFGCPVVDHCEDLNLSEGGVMNEGFVSTGLGLRGIPSISEELIIARDLLVAEFTKASIHIAHVSTKGSVSLIRDAKGRGVKVSAETCPHYLVLTDEAVRSFDTNTKMKPPLRTEEDRQALIEGLKDGTIDVIATDHAPHAIHEKEVEYNAASFGIIGFETAVGLVMTFLLKKNLLTLDEIVEKMAIIPRKILNLEENCIEENTYANLTLLDPELKWQVDCTCFHSKSNNTPFNGWKLQGKSFGVYNNGILFLRSTD
jgi:dihydroorotase